MPYDDKYYERHANEIASWQNHMAKYLYDPANGVFPPGCESIVDFGCGVGTFLKPAKENKYSKIKGIELNFNTSKKFTPEDVVQFISAADMTNELDIGKFDIVLSFEAAEHIQPSGTNNFINNIVNSCNKRIIMTAAQPGQKGTGHINCRPRSFWISEITKRGMAYRSDISIKIMKDFENINNSVPTDIPWYMVANMMVFEKL